MMISIVQGVATDLIKNPLEDFTALYNKHALRNSREWSWITLTSAGLALRSCYEIVLGYNYSTPMNQQPLASEAIPKIDATIWKLKELIDQNKTLIFSDYATFCLLIRLQYIYKNLLCNFQENSPKVTLPPESKVSEQTQALFRKILLFETYIYDASSQHQTLPYQVDYLNWDYYLTKALKNKNIPLCKACWSTRESLKIEYTQYSPSFLFRIYCLVNDSKNFFLSLQATSMEEIKEILHTEKFSLEEYFNIPTNEDYTLILQAGETNRQYSLLPKVLAARSDYFLGYWRQAFDISLPHTIKVNDLESADKVLRFLYSGKITIDAQNIQSIYTLAKYLIIPDLEKICRESESSAHLDEDTGLPF